MEKSVKGQISELNSIVQSIMSKFDIAYIEEYEMRKPSLYNLWMVADPKITDFELVTAVSKLSENNFCKESDVEKISCELQKTKKSRIAILPRNCLDLIISDLRSVINNYEIEFVLNECVE